MYCLVCQLVCLSRYSERKLVNESKQVGLSLRQFEVWRSTAATMQPLQYCKTKSERVKKKSYPERRRVLRLKTWVQVLHNPLPPIPVDLFTFGSQTQGRKENISRLCVWVLPLKDLPFYSQFMILWFKLLYSRNCKNICLDERVHDCLLFLSLTAAWWSQKAVQGSVPGAGQPSRRAG